MPLRRMPRHGDSGAEPPRRPWRVEGGSDRRAQRALPLLRRYWWLVVLLLGVNWYLAAQIGKREAPTTVPYTYFRAQVQAGNVARVTSTADKIQGTFRRPVAYPAGHPGSRSFETRRPAFANDALLPLLLHEHVVVDAKPPSAERPVWVTLLVSIVPTLLLVGLLVFVMKKAVSGGGVGGLGKSRAKRYRASWDRTTFDDVAGIDEAKDELAEIVEYLRDPDRYAQLGAAIPKGVLLSGPPGTGKTLLARAVAGEADVPFYSLSASEFIEMVAGVGASRVRDLFAEAKRHAPAMIFIDELDAIGRARGAGGGSSAALDEREQTLNQILTEMDGFSGSEGVIVLAATNRPDVLDQALLRPGRFDRRVTVSAPDHAGRRRILEVHLRRVPLGGDVDPAQIAARSTGMVGADLKNLVNEAALLAARHRRAEVTLEDFAAALEKIILGAERRITLSDEDRERTAYHEAGHALLGMLEPGADPVRKVSIVPRGSALGITFQSPSSDRYGYSTEYLLGRIVGALGGRAAEQVVFGNVTTGAESDLEHATHIARQMVGRWGMSDAVGLVSVLPPRTAVGGAPLHDEPAPGSVSEATRELVDVEVRRITAECYRVAVARLEEERPRLEALTAALLEHETLDEVEAYGAAGFDRPELDASPEGRRNGQPARLARRLLGEIGRSERGGTLVEYAVILFFVSIVGVGALELIGVRVGDLLAGIPGAL